MNHLGGHGDTSWTDEGTLKFVRDYLRIRSMIDIGSGPPAQALLARGLGIDAVSVDGDASVRPDHVVDFTKGTLETDREFDLAWSVEFLEHVPERFADNYMALFRKCRYVICTASFLASPQHYHLRHVGYWITLFEDHGFDYSPFLRNLILRHSTMKPYDISVTFLQSTGMTFIRKDVDSPVPVQREEPWPLNT